MRTRLFYLFFKQKTAYEMRISDWSSDVCNAELSQRKAVQWSGNAEWPALREPGRQSHRRDQRAAAKGRGSGHRSARHDLDAGHDYLPSASGLLQVPAGDGHVRRAARQRVFTRGVVGERLGHVLSVR